MIKNFFILDVSYEVKNNSPLIYIWCIDENNERALLIERTFKPYFYVAFEGNREKIIEEIKGISKQESPIESIETVKRKALNNTDIDVLLIKTRIPTYVRIYRNLVTKIKGVKDVYEADIRFSMRYLIDNDLKPFSWVQAEVEEVSSNEGIRVNKIYELKKVISRYEDKRPDLRTLAFDIEVYTRYGYPNPRRDPLILIGLWTNQGGFQISSDDELKVFRSFVDFILKYDPDVIVGYNSNEFAWPYMLERAKTLGVRIEIGRKPEVEVSQGTYGHYSISGRLNVDLGGTLKLLTRSDIEDICKSAEYFNLYECKNKTLKWYQIRKYWDNAKEKDLVKEYNMEKVKLIYLLSQKILPVSEQISEITGFPLDHLPAANITSSIEWLLIREAYKMQQLVPNKRDQDKEKNKSDLLIPPIPGLHENVYVLDITPIYISKILEYNISPDTLVNGECEVCKGVFNYRFRTEPKGLYPSVLGKLIGLSDRDRAINVILRTFLLYLRRTSSRWYNKEINELIDTLGKDIVSNITKMIEGNDVKVIYADLTSVFLKGKAEDISELVKNINQLYLTNINIEKNYKKIIFLENSNAFIGLLENGKIEVFGLKRFRENLCDLARELQDQVINSILSSNNIKDVIKFVRTSIAKLKRGEYNIEDLAIWGVVDSFSNPKPPQVIAAEKANKSGYLVAKGDKIGYVIIKGSSNVSNRAEPFFMVKEKNKIDVEYYLNNQIIPSLIIVLKYFGIKEKDLKMLGADILDLF